MPAIVSPVRWIGAKSHLRKWIISQFPEHRTYVEPFAGSAAVLLNKPPSKVEVYNDRDERLHVVFSVLRDPILSKRLAEQLDLTLYHERDFANTWSDPRPIDPVAAARAAIVQLRMAFGGAGSRGIKPGFGFSKANNPASQFAAFRLEIPRITERLANVQIMCRPAESVIDRFDSEDTLFYCDPPYVPSSRKSSRDYIHEMSTEEHEALAAQLNQVDGKVLISGYDSPQYRSWFKSWNVRSRDVSLRVARDKSQTRKEFAWSNF